VQYRGFTFVVKHTLAARPIGVGQNRIDWKGQTWTLASFGLALGLLLLFYLTPPSTENLSLELLNADSRVVQYMIEPLPQPKDEPEWLKPKDDGGGKGQRHKADEGRMGKKDNAKAEHKYGIEGPRNNPDPHMAREEAKEMAQTAGIIGLLKTGAEKQPTSPFGRDTALGNDAQSALGALMGDQVGANFGFGGLGAKGAGRGGGGTAEGTIGVGAVGTLGHGSGTGAGAGYGSGAGSLHGRETKVPRIRSATADVRGSLSKDVIRRVINRHRNEVLFCYEQELNSRPGLQGRVAIKFIIAPSGEVLNAAVDNSNMGSVKVEQCIAQAVRRWSFPAPDGGGLVTVTYPFVFEPVGG
jgi:TonB family protein